MPTVDRPQACEIMGNALRILGKLGTGIPVFIRLFRDRQVPHFLRKLGTLACKQPGPAVLVQYTLH